MEGFTLTGALRNNFAPYLQIETKFTTRKFIFSFLKYILTKVAAKWSLFIITLSFCDSEGETSHKCATPPVIVVKWKNSVANVTVLVIISSPVSDDDDTFCN